MEMFIFRSLLPGIIVAVSSSRWMRGNYVITMLASPRETGLFPCMHAGVLVGPGRERWGIECRTMRQLTGQDAGPFNPWKCRGSKEDEAAEEAAAPRAPDLRGERVRPPDSAPYLDPSFQNTAPPSQPSQPRRGHQDPLFVLDTLSPLDNILLFLLNKSLSEAWRHAHCVCRLLLPPHWWRIAGKAEPRQRSWATPDDVIPSRSQKKFMEIRTGRRNDGDGLPATTWVSDVPFFVIYPVVGWGCRLKPGFLSRFRHGVERESCPGEESLPRPLRPLELG